MSTNEKSERLIEAAAAILNAAPDRRLNAVVLNKALFYLDLASLRDRGETVTHNSYIALEKGPKRLHEDHANARALAEGLANISGIEIDVEKAVTNIVIFDITRTGKTSAEIVSALSDKGVLAIGFGNLIRMVTHCDVSADDIFTTINALGSICS